MPKYINVLLLLLFRLADAPAQSLGNAGTLEGGLRDASGAPVPFAGVELSNPMSGYSQKIRTGPDGAFVINGIPPNTSTACASTPPWVTPTPGSSARKTEAL